MEGSFKRAAVEVSLGAAVSGIICLFAASLFAVFVRAFAPADVVIAIVDRVLRCLGIFAGTLLFVRPERALFKGMASGLLGFLLTTLVFGIIGGFHIGPLFPADLLLSAAAGALGGLLGAKLRKE